MVRAGKNWFAALLLTGCSAITGNVTFESDPDAGPPMDASGDAGDATKLSLISALEAAQDISSETFQAVRGSLVASIDGAEQIVKGEYARSSRRSQEPGSASPPEPTDS